MQMIFSCMCLIWLMMLVFIAGVCNAGTDLITNQTITFSSLLNFYGQSSSEVTVKVTPKQKLLVKYDTIKPFFVRRLDTSLIEQIEEQVVDGYLDSDLLKSYDITIQLSSQTFETNIEIPTELLADSGLYLFDQSIPNLNYLASTSFSGFLNYFFGVAQDDRQQNGSEWSSGNTFEVGLRYDRLNFTTDVAADFNSEQNEFYRLESQFTYDFPDEGTRVTLGDHSFQSFGFQGSTSLLGLNINRNFGVIPTKNVRPITNQRFVIERPSTVDLYIDGVLLRSLNLSPGSYDIRDIPLTTGINRIELVITDPSGRQEVLFFNVAAGVNLLAEGEFEYSLTVGVDSELTENELNYDSDDYIISAGIEYGVTESFTVGYNTQGRENIYQFGVMFGFATVYGLFGAEAAYSDHQAIEDGYAGRLNYSGFFSDDDYNFDAQYEYRSLRFTNISDSSIDDISGNDTASKHRLDMFYSYQFSSGLYAGLSGNINILHNDDVNYAVTTSFSGSWLNSQASWNIRGTYEDSESDGEDEVRIFISTTIPINLLLNNNHNMSATYDSDNNRYQTRYSYNDSSGAVGGVGVFALMETSDNNDFNSNVSVNYTGNRYLLGFEHDSLVDLNSDYSSRNQLTFQGALAFASGQSDNYVAVGRPISDSFAIITTHKSLDDSHVIINPESNGTYAIESDIFGPLLMPDIVSYRAQRIDYDIKDLPIGYDLGEGGFSINPTHRNAYALTIGSNANITAMGYIFDVNGEVVPLTEGVATHSEDENFPPIDFFTNSKGRFAITGLKPGIYTVTLYSVNPINFTVTIPDGEGNIIRMGEIRAAK